MTRFSPAEIRNVALVGHGGAGKTTLAEALLHRAGAIDRLGRVDDGTTVCDHEPEEQRRHLSLSLAVAPFEWKGHKVNLVDTPGYADFVGEVRAALRVVDLAVFVVSAVDGVEVQTEAIWREAERLGLPRMIFVNKLDRERASFTRTLDQLRDRFGAGIAPLELPIGEEAAFHGVADLLTDTAYLYTDGQVATGPIPDEMEALEHQVHDNLVEGIVVADDALLEGYLDGQIPSFEQLEHTLAVGVDEASVFPVVCGSATAEVAIDRLADFICEIGPSPLDRPPVTVTAGDVEVDVTPDETAEPLVTVFKTIADPYVGRITLFKVLSGTLHVDDHLVNPRSGADERLHGLALMRGKEQLPASEIPAGDLGAVAKLTDTVTGDTLAPKGRPVVLPHPDEPAPAYSVAVVPHTQADDDKLATALHRITDEDPSIHVSRNDETHQTLVSGAGDTHVAVTLERLERRFGVHVDTEDVRVAYRETISGTAEAEGKYKKQTGGPRPVRPGRDPGRTARPRRRVRVRRQDRGRGHPAPVHPCRAEGRRGGHVARRRVRLPRRRRAGVVPRRQVPLRRQLRDELQDGGAPRLPGRHRQGLTCAARAHLPAHRHRPERAAGRRAGRPQRPAGAGSGHRGGRRRRARHPRPRAHRRAAALRHRPAVPHRWARPLHRRARPLRPAPRPPGRPRQARRPRGRVALGPGRSPTATRPRPCLGTEMCS